MLMHVYLVGGGAFTVAVESCAKEHKPGYVTGLAAVPPATNLTWVPLAGAKKRIEFLRFESIAAVVLEEVDGEAAAPDPTAPDARGSNMGSYPSAV